MQNFEEFAKIITKQVCDLEKVVSNRDIYYFKLVLFSNVFTMIVSFGSGLFFGYIFGRGSQEKIIDEILRRMRRN